ncbi:hypothetical protein [Ruminococcus sp.]|uniref:hypothetical protein n=1 Tax=Ruminococcus sp. TaxID=41978 RepID=UPI0038684AE8
MKRTKRIIGLMLSLLLILSLCACGKQKATPASGESLSYVGKYTAFAMVHDDYRDYLVDLGDNSSEITLNEDGTGVLTLSTEKGEGKIEKWKVEGGLIDVTVSNRTLFGPVENGNVLRLYFEKETLTIYYAKEGTDTSSYNVLSQEAFKETIAAKSSK